MKRRFGTKLVCIAAVVAVAVPGWAHAEITEEEIDATPEVANGIAVANDGTTLASFRDSKQLALVKADGTASRIDIGCNPMAVAIAPIPTLGWAVCDGDQHLTIVDLRSGSTSVAGVGITRPVALAYSPSERVIVIGEDSGRVTVVSARSPGNYEVLKTYSVGESLWAITLAQSGTIAYAVAAVGSIERFNFMTGLKATLKLTVPTMYVTSLSISPSTNVLYAAGGELSDGRDPVSVAIALSPKTGKTIQRKELPSNQSGFGDIKVVAAHRTLFVGSGIGVDNGVSVNGLVGIGLDAFGRFEKFTDVTSTPKYIGSLALSANMGKLATSTTNNELFRFSTGDKKYKPTVSISGSVRSGTLKLIGRTVGFKPGSKVTIYVKTSNSFVAQKAQATIRRNGTFTWTASTEEKSLAIYAKIAKSRSRAIVINTI